MLLSALSVSQLHGGSVHRMRSVFIRATKALQSSERSLLMLKGGPSSLAQSPRARSEALSRATALTTRRRASAVLASSPLYQDHLLFVHWPRSFASVL
jgi:hypothetical protein